MEPVPFFFWNRLAVNKTRPTIKAIIKILNAKKDNSAKLSMIQKTKANLVVKGIFWLEPICWKKNILKKDCKYSFNFRRGFVIMNHD